MFIRFCICLNCDTKQTKDEFVNLKCENCNSQIKVGCKTCKQRLIVYSCRRCGDNKLCNNCAVYDDYKEKYFCKNYYCKDLKKDKNNYKTPAIEWIDERTHFGDIVEQKTKQLKSMMMNGNN